MSLHFEPVWSWWITIPLCIVLIGMVLLSYPRRVQHLGKLHRRVLVGLRLFAALVLCLAMLRPAIQFSETDRNQAVLYVIGDASRSMTVPDGPGGMTRREAMLSTLAETQPQFEKLSELIDIRYYDFADRLTAVEKLEDRTDGLVSAIGFSLDELLRDAGEQTVLGAILFSDGAERIPVGTVDARSTARRWGELQVPIYTVGHGGAGSRGAGYDLAIEDLVVDRLAFEKNVVPISAKVRAIGVAGRDLSVRVMIEDRQGVKVGESGVLKPARQAPGSTPVKKIRPAGNSEVIPVDLSFVPVLPGEYKIAIQVDVLDGEIKDTNNIRETVITIQQGGIRVAYFDRPTRFEPIWIRRLNSDTRIQLDFQPIREGEFRGQSSIDESWFVSGSYDAYIIGDVPADVFGPRVLRKLAAAVDDGAGLLMIGGYNNFGPGGYAGTSISELMPVEMKRSEVQAKGEIDPLLHYQRELKIIPTTAGLKHFVMQIDKGGNNRERWAKLSPLERGSKLKARDGGLVSVLAETKDGTPLLVAHDVGRSRVAAFAGDTTWQWVTVDDDLDAHQRFWRQMVMWLSHKEDESNLPVWVQVDPKNFAPGQDVPIEFGAQENGARIADAKFEIQITNPNGDPLPAIAMKNDEVDSATFKQTKLQGDYWVRARATRDGNALGIDAYTRFIVDARDPELDNPVSDFALLEEIAALSGGDVLPPEQLSNRLETWLNDGIPNLEITRFSTTTLWDNWVFLIVFVGVLSTEWFLRKRRGLV